MFSLVQQENLLVVHGPKMGQRNPIVTLTDGKSGQNPNKQINLILRIPSQG